MKRALVTIVFGESYRAGFEKYAYPGWQSYARKQGYDIRVIEFPIDQVDLQGAVESLRSQLKRFPGRPPIQVAT